MKTVVRQLPFFPTPYPDESFYSILCRYHVRSGAPTSASTINRLFGKNYLDLEDAGDKELYDPKAF